MLPIKLEISVNRICRSPNQLPERVSITLADCTITTSDNLVVIHFISLDETTHTTLDLPVIHKRF